MRTHMYQDYFYSPDSQFKGDTVTDIDGCGVHPGPARRQTLLSLNDLCKRQSPRKSNVAFWPPDSGDIESRLQYR